MLNLKIEYISQSLHSRAHLINFRLASMRLTFEGIIDHLNMRDTLASTKPFGLQT